VHIAIGGSMKFNLVIDIPDEAIEQASHDIEMPMEELINKISNTCYLGMDCINAMLHRQYELEAGDWYVSSVMGDDETIYAD
jgi:hypothetical protein